MAAPTSGTKSSGQTGATSRGSAAAMALGFDLEGAPALLMLGFERLEPLAETPGEDRVQAEDIGVLMVVRIVSRAQADLLEAVLVVEREGRRVRDPALERD